MKRLAYAIDDNVLAFTLAVLTLCIGAVVAGSTGHTTFAWIDGGLAAATFAVMAVCHRMTIARDGRVEIG